ncbi:MAG: hypothetical protein KAR01_07915 [Desulfocapsa sp.]|nr:hypothetical protein [Desulfocapsa sp.]
MSIPALLLGSLFVAISIFMILKAREKTTALKKYESENRSSDGVVEFANIDLSRAHEADKGLYTVIGVVGFFVGVVGVMLFVAGLKL